MKCLCYYFGVKPFKKFNLEFVYTKNTYQNLGCLYA